MSEPPTKLAAALANKLAFERNGPAVLVCTVDSSPRGVERDTTDSPLKGPDVFGDAEAFARAQAIDRAYFENNPQETYHLREFIFGEGPASPPPGYRTIVWVTNIGPGVRIREFLFIKKDYDPNAANGIVFLRDPETGWITLHPLTDE